MSGNSFVHDVESMVTSLTTGGLPAFQGLEWLVQHLLSRGEDPVTFIETLITHIEGRANVAAVLEEFTAGVMANGIEGFAKINGDQILRPVLQALQTHSAAGYQLANLHQHTISTVNSKLAALTTGQTPSGMAYKGKSATTMLASISTVTTRLHALTIATASPQDQINQDFAHAMSTYIAGALAIDLAILSVEFIASAIVVTIPEELVLDSGVILVELLGLIVLAVIEGAIWIFRTGALHMQQMQDGESQSIPKSSESSTGKIQPKPAKKNFPPQMRDDIIKAFIAAFGGAALRELLSSITSAQKQDLKDLFGVNGSALSAFIAYCLAKNPLMTTQQFIDALTAQNVIARDQELLTELQTKQKDPRYQGPGLNESFQKMENSIKTDIKRIENLENNIILADYSSSKQVNKFAGQLSNVDDSFKGKWGVWKLAEYYGDQGKLLFFDHTFGITDIDVGIRDGNGMKFLQVKTLNSSYSPYQRKDGQIIYENDGKPKNSSKFDELKKNIEGTQKEIDNKIRIDDERRKYKWFNGHVTIEADLMNTQGNGNWSEVDKVIHEKYPQVEVHTTNPLDIGQKDIDYNGHENNPLYNQQFRNAVTTLPELNPNWCLPSVN